MRISTNQIFSQGLRGFQSQQVEIARIQMQLASGQKHLRPSDDPAEVARSLELEQIVSVTRQYQDNIDMAESRLRLEETTLGSANDLLVRVRELAVQGASTILSDDARQALVAEQESLEQEKRSASAQNEILVARQKLLTTWSRAINLPPCSKAGSRHIRHLRIGHLSRGGMSHP